MKPVVPRLLSLPFNSLAVILAMAFAVLLVIMSVQRIAALAAEAGRIREDVTALLTSQHMVKVEKIQRFKDMKKKGLGLRLKFAFLVTLLVLGIVVMVAIPLGKFMIETESRNLAEGLKQSTTVLLESLATGVNAYLPSQNTLELGLLPSQISAMEDALYVTLTSAGINDPENQDYIWATNDRGIAEKIEDQSVNTGLPA